MVSHCETVIAEIITRFLCKPSSSSLSFPWQVELMGNQTLSYNIIHVWSSLCTIRAKKQHRWHLGLFIVSNFSLRVHWSEASKVPQGWLWDWSISCWWGEAGRAGVVWPGAEKVQQHLIHVYKHVSVYPGHLLTSFLGDSPPAVLLSPTSTAHIQNQVWHSAAVKPRIRFLWKQPSC